MPRLAFALQRWATGSPARCTTASRPASAPAGAGPASGSHAAASTPSAAPALAGSRDRTVTSSPRTRSAPTRRAPMRPVAPVIVMRIAGRYVAARPRGSARAQALGVDGREADRVPGPVVPRAPRLRGHRIRDGRRDVAVEHRRDDVVLAQLG